MQPGTSIIIIYTGSIILHAIWNASSIARETEICGLTIEGTSHLVKNRSRCLIWNCFYNDTLFLDILSSFFFVLQIMVAINTLRPRQNGCHFPDDIFKCIFLNENVRILIGISLNFILKGPINNIPALAQKNGLAPTRLPAIIWKNACMYQSVSMS